MQITLENFNQLLALKLNPENRWAARFGGDEFVICLNDTDTDRARVVAERILNNIGNIFIPFNDKSIRVTISIGIHTVLKQVLTATDIIKLADQNMYESKDLRQKPHYNQRRNVKKSPCSLLF